MIEGLFIPEEMRDTTLDKHIMEKLEEYEAVQKAVLEDHKWAAETAVIFANEMGDFVSPEEQAFLNGVRFATHKYMQIMKVPEEKEKKLYFDNQEVTVNEQS